MTPEEYWAYKAFTRDDAGEKALSSSEVFTAYRNAEMQRERELKQINASEKSAEEKAALEAFDEFEKKVNASPKLKAELKKAKAALDASPELEKQVDPNFIAGLRMLDLDD